MTFFYHSNSDKSDREVYLERELEDVREAEERRHEREERAREERRREQEENFRYQERQADDWPDAFRKQARLCWHEHNAFPEQASEVTGDPADDYFKNTAQANEKALEIWTEVAASKQAKIRELQKQIAAVWDEVRTEVAGKLTAASPLPEYAQTAEQIRSDDLDNYLQW